MKTIFILFFLLEASSYTKAQTRADATASSNATIVSRYKSGGKIEVTHSNALTIASDVFRGSITETDEYTVPSAFLFSKNISISLSNDPGTRLLPSSSLLTIEVASLDHTPIKRQGTIFVSVMSPDASCIQSGTYSKWLDIVVAYN